MLSNAQREIVEETSTDILSIFPQIERQVIHIGTLLEMDEWTDAHEQIKELLQGLTICHEALCFLRKVEISEQLSQN